MFLKAYVLLAVVGLSLSATWQMYLPPIPKEHAGKEGCYIEEINEVVPFGTVVKPIGHCYRITCGDQMLFYASCGVVSTSDPKLVIVTKIDLTKPYPDCCPKLKHVDDNTVLSKKHIDDNTV